MARTTVDEEIARRDRQIAETPIPWSAGVTSSQGDRPERQRPSRLPRTSLLPSSRQRAGRKTAGTASVTLDTKTKVRGGGMKSVAHLVADLKAGDRVHVQARVCKDDLNDNAKPALTASKVVRHPAKAESEEDDD